MKRIPIIAVIVAAVLAVGCGNEQENSNSTNTEAATVEAGKGDISKKSPEDIASKVPSSEAQHSAAAPTTAKDALEALREGNKRFVEGISIHPHESTDYRASLSDEQHPFATVLACSDSRVTPVLIFDQGIGDLFVIRVAGNIVDVDVAGSIEYAVDHLQTKLLVVMGHESCGAVTAAYHAFIARDLDADEPNEIVSLLKRIEPALRNVDPAKTQNEQIAQGVEENVREAIRQLLRIPDLHQAQEQGRLEVVGAVYSLSTGEVRMLEE